MDKWGKNIGEHKKIIGIAFDEHKRKNTKVAQESILPLDIYGITEEMAFEICKKNELLSPAYNNGRFRLGCWFCHNQKLSEFQRLRTEYPHLWEELLELDNNCKNMFTPRHTVHDLEARFKEESKR